MTGDQLLGNGSEVTVPVEDDSVLESLERFQVRLQLTPQSLNLGVINLGQSMGEVIITDNDGESIIVVSSCQPAGCCSNND